MRRTTPYSALIFSEYALELSNLDMYFPKEQGIRLPPGLSDALILFGLGALFGAGIVVFILGRKLNASIAAHRITSERRMPTNPKLVRSSAVGNRRRKGQKRVGK